MKDDLRLFFSEQRFWIGTNRDSPVFFVDGEIWRRIILRGTRHDFAADQKLDRRSINMNTKCERGIVLRCVYVIASRLAPCL